MASLANHSELSHEQAQVQFHELMNLCSVERGQRLGGQFGRQITDLVEFLTRRTEWMKTPASTKYHLCVEGGLVIHSVNVTKTAIKLRDCLMPDIPLDSVILCGMMHDAGKIYSQSRPDGTVAPRYLVNILKSTGKRSDAQPYAYNEGGNDIPLTVKDLLIPLKFVDMSDAEMQAIMLADGQYVAVNEDLAHHETPLACIIHWADYWEGHVKEGNIQADWLNNLFRGRL